MRQRPHLTLLGSRPRLWPALMSAAGLVVLLGLGTWQVQRLHWKLGLIATMKARMYGPAVALPPGVGVDPTAWAYRRVIVTGRYLNDKEMHLLAYNPAGRMGYDLVTPLIRSRGEGAVLVNRGWVPTEKQDPASRPGSEIAGPVTIIGIVHPGWRRALFVPHNEPASNQWFAGDTVEMGAYAGLALPPVLIDRVAGPDPRALPQGGQTKVNLPNHHLQYAITWYLLALSLVVIFVIYHRKRAAEGEAGAAGVVDEAGAADTRRQGQP